MRGLKKAFVLISIFLFLAGSISATVKNGKYEKEYKQESSQLYLTLKEFIKDEIKRQVDEIHDLQKDEEIKMLEKKVNKYKKRCKEYQCSSEEKEKNMKCAMVESLKKEWEEFKKKRPQAIPIITNFDIDFEKICDSFVNINFNAPVKADATALRVNATGAGVTV